MSDEEPFIGPPDEYDWWASNPRPQLTVGQLIEQLSKIDPDLPVQTQGCDCDGDATGVSISMDYSGLRGSYRVAYIHRGDMP